MQQFIDMHSRPICDGAKVYFHGEFPNQVPMEKHIRDGIAIIDGDKLVFAVYINDQLQGIGLYWELDGEPCYDLVITEEDKYRLDFYDANSDEIIASYEGNDLDSLYAQGFHHLDRGYGMETNIKTIKYRNITAEISLCRRGYKCVVTDTLGNDISWFIRANTMHEAIVKTTRSFNNVMRYLRGFIILSEFLRRVEEN